MSLRHMDNAWFRNNLAHSLGGKRHPFTGTFELTWRCNLRCRHCYLGGQTFPLPELDTLSIQKLLDQVAEAGCLTLSITGGEPTLRQDFESIWQHAHGLGFLLNLFTNGTLIDESRAQFLAQHPPQNIEVSIYGTSPEIYKKVTGSAKAYDQAYQGIEFLRALDLPVMVKTMIQEDLADEAQAMIKTAKTQGLRIRMDPGLDPRLDKNDEPLGYRIPAEQAAELEMQAYDDIERVKDYHDGWKKHPESWRQSPCGAGHNSFHLDPAGRLMPCMLLRQSMFEPLAGSFHDAWEAMGKTGRIHFKKSSPCYGCELQHLCSQCPGIDALGKKPTKRFDPEYYNCQVAQLRANMLESFGV